MSASVFKRKKAIRGYVAGNIDDKLRGGGDEWTW
jgi:hypothetical protein